MQVHSYTLRYDTKNKYQRRMFMSKNAFCDALRLNVLSKKGVVYIVHCGCKVYNT